jgi:hypothetical protein
MSWLSEESLLLAENWDTVEDILKAKDRLGSELSKLLLSVESELSRHDWWGDGWRFIQYRENQVYVSREDWRLDGAFLVWIGVEMFGPEGLFGTASSPQLYVWVGRKQHDLAQTLAEAIEESEGETLGEIDHRETGYVVKHPVQKCVPGEVEGFDDVVRGQIAEFFAHYAKVLSRFDGMIQDRISRLREETAPTGA